MPGAGLAHGPPAEKNAGGRYHRFSRTSRHSLRDGLPAYTCSPWGPALLPPCANRVKRFAHGISTGMPGPHDFAVRAASFVRARNVHCDTSRPPHARLASRDDRAYAPLLEAGWGHRNMISVKAKVEYFSRNGWTEVMRLNALTNLVFPRRRFSLPVRQLTAGSIVRAARLICPTSEFRRQCRSCERGDDAFFAEALDLVRACRPGVRRDDRLLLRKGCVSGAHERRHVISSRETARAVAGRR